MISKLSLSMESKDGKWQYLSSISLYEKVTTWNGLEKPCLLAFVVVLDCLLVSLQLDALVQARGQLEEKLALLQKRRYARVLLHGLAVL